MTTAATLMIANLNRVGELRKTLSSFREQRGADFETIVVDDALCDGTAKSVRLESLEVTLRRFEESRGRVAAREEVLQRAAGEIVVGLDDDGQFIEPNVLVRVVRRMRAEPDLDVLGFQPVGPEHPEPMSEDGCLREGNTALPFGASGERALIELSASRDD